MIDYIALTLAHGLLVIGLFRIARNKELDPAVPLPQRRHNAAKRQAPVSNDGQLDAQAEAGEAP